MKSCNNCDTPNTTGNSSYTAEYCGSDYKLCTNKCTCGNPEFGFDCVCDHVENNPGNIDFSCEFHGLYTASIPRCNKCERD